MLIDDTSKIARLSSTAPGMSSFQPILVFIWVRLGLIKKEIDKQHAHQTDGRKEEYLKKKLGEDVAQILEETKLYIPSNFIEFITEQKTEWIANAVEALNYFENIHYIIQDGEIKPVDFDSTGIVQSSTTWSRGLHQFLQMKHNLRMMDETATTSFISNVGFIKKYRQFYGLTGTLGSKSTRETLKDVYKVDLYNIPQRWEKQFFELDSLITKNEGEWLQEIFCNVSLEVKKGRGILVICETIEHAYDINQNLKRNLGQMSVKLYVMNDMNQERYVEKISPGEVIIATNLAGRGTDIQANEIEETGGLHVVLTFLPVNQRVEEQAFGRTARQGKRGTGIIILNSQDFTTQTSNAKQERDKAEVNQLQKFKNHELNFIKMKDELFGKFCKFLNDDIRVMIQGQDSTSKNFLNVSGGSETCYNIVETYIIAAVEERWAGFLNKLDSKKITLEKAPDKFEEFIKQLQKDFDQNAIIKNPYLYTSMANEILGNKEWFSSNLSEKQKNACQLFDQAISMEREFWQKELRSATVSFLREEDVDIFCPGAAHFGVAWCSILLREKGYKQKALLSFERALKCQSNEMSILNSIQMFLKKNQPCYHNSDLEKQLSARANVLGVYLIGIEGCIQDIKISMRLIDATWIKPKKKKGEESRKYFYELEKKRDAFANEVKLESKSKYSLVFNHLKSFGRDSDEALETLRNVHENNLQSDSNCVRINLFGVSLADIKCKLFDLDKILHERVCKRSALDELKKQLLAAEESGFEKAPKLLDLTVHPEDSTKTFKGKEIKELIGIVGDIDGSNTTFDIVLKECNVDEAKEFFRWNERESISEIEMKFQGLCEDIRAIGGQVTRTGSWKSALKILRNKFEIPSFFSEILQSLPEGESDSTDCAETELTLNLAYKKLSKEDAIHKLSAIESKSFDIDMILDKSTLLKLIEPNPSLEYGVLHCEANSYEKLHRDSIFQHLDKLRSDEATCFIKFEECTLEQAKYIIENCYQKVNVCFRDISSFDKNELPEVKVDFSFENVNQASAEEIINLLRKHNFDFSVEFYHLTSEKVKNILTHHNSIPKTEEELEISCRKNIKDQVTKDLLFTHELKEFKSIGRGIDFILQLSEKRAIPWKTICSLGVLSGVQVTAAAQLMSCGQLLPGLQCLYAGWVDILGGSTSSIS